jgi:DNA-binding transcriptional ArsR family regulator
MRIKNFSIQGAAQLFKALSEESRLRIIHLIFHKKEMSVSDLELVLDYTQTKTSRHLSYLRNAGLVTTRKIDQWTFYTIKDEVREALSGLLELLRDSDLKEDLETYHVLYASQELAICKVQNKKWMNPHRSYPPSTDNTED